MTDAIDDTWPGADLVRAGLEDVRRGRESIEGLLVLVGAPRLRRLGIAIPDRTVVPHPEHRLYELLARSDSDTAHGRDNALIRRPVSFERAAECAPVDAARLPALMRHLGAAARHPGRVYLTGGATAVLEGWRGSTIDGLVEPRRLLELFYTIEPALVRYPALDPPTFRRAVEAVVARR